MREYLKKLNKKKATIVAICICIAFCGVAGTIAYLISRTDPLENTFLPAQVTCEVEENFSSGIKSDVRVRNTGDVNAYIRATVVVTFTTDDGKVYSKTPVEGVNYSVTLSNNKWEKGTDGFWYYAESVVPNAATENLIDQAVELSTPDGYRLNVQILATAIQSEPDAAVQSAWGITPINGKITPN